MFRNALVALMLASSLWHIPTTSAAATKRPNVVFIFTDDQDAQLNSLDYMPNVQKLLIDQGTHFKSHYCTVALCCPSRVSMWTGKAAHNTNVTNVNYPGGGYQKFVEQGLNDQWVPVWLQNEGYQTYYTGKLMNAQNIGNWDKPLPKGFSGSDFLLDPNTYDYLNPIFQRNAEPPVLYQNNYTTDLVHQRGIGFLEEAVKNPDSPFFLTIAPVAPHSQFLRASNSSDIDISPPIAKDQYKDLFSDVIAPRTPNFNPDEPSSVDWIAQLPQLSAEEVAYGDQLYRQRLRALQSVDEIVADVFAKLEEYGILDNTYVFYSADNGYHIGQHRLAPGKGCGFETDINVPLIVRGPGVPAGKVVTRTTTHTDMAPTWWKILGIPLRDDFDGLPIPLTEDGLSELESSSQAKEHIQVEFWSDSNIQEWPQDLDNGAESNVNNTYKGIRIVSEHYGFYYSVWCSNSHEFYDMKTDPYQMNNLYRAANATSHDTSIPVGNQSYSLNAITTRLDALLLILKTCKGKPCTEPWETLLPGKNVYTLAEAMNAQYDDYFAQLPRVEYDHCEAVYIKSAEGPMWDDSLAIQKQTRNVEWGWQWDIHALARKGRNSMNRP